MALALYRKYRPATFGEVVGQEHVTEPLRVALDSGRINHAYLFSGPRGCGKTSSARILARSLNCEQGPTSQPCGECGPCVALAPEGPGSVDVTELDAASHGGVDDARELRDRAFYAPAESRYRVFVIDEAHMVTNQGFNALLKVVEEPPEHLIFIFATTEPDKVISTIRSRTHHYPFRLLPPNAMRGLLERNAAAESVAVEPAVYPLLIRAGGGSARDTQSVLDQLIAGAGPDGVTYQHAVSLLGVTDSALLDDLIDGLGADDAAAVFGTVERLADAGHDPRRFASDLLDRLRDLVLLRTVPDAGERGLVTAPEDLVTRMRDQTQRLGHATLTRYAEIVHNGLLEMRGATSARLVLELLCARMLLPAAAADEAAVLQRLERLERRASASAQSSAPQSEAPRQQAPQPDPPQPQAPDTQPETAATSPRAPAEEPTTAEPAAQPTQPTPAAPAQESEQGAEPSSGAGGLDTTELRRIWPELLDRVSQRHKPTLVLLQNATLRSIEGNTLVLAMPTAGLARQLDQESRTRHIVAAMHQIFGGEWTVRCVHGDDGGTAPDGGTSPPEPTRPEGSVPASAPEPAPPAVGESASPSERPADTPASGPSTMPQDDSAAAGGSPESARPASAAEPDERAEPPDPDEQAQRLLAEQLGARHTG